MKLFGWVRRFADRELHENNEALAKAVNNLVVVNEALGGLVKDARASRRVAGQLLNAILWKAGGKVTLSKDDLDVGQALPAYRMEQVEGGVLVRLATANEEDE